MSAITSRGKHHTYTYRGKKSADDSQGESTWFLAGEHKVAAEHKKHAEGERLPRQIGIAVVTSEGGGMQTCKQAENAKEETAYGQELFFER